MGKNKTPQIDKTKIAESKAEAKARFWKQVDELLMSEGKGTEIAAYFGITPSAFYERCRREKQMDFSVYKQILKEKGDVLLRHAQFQKAVKGKDGRMQIFLGKNRLGQTDRQVIITEQAEPQKAILKLPDNGRRIIIEPTENDVANNLRTTAGATN